jgi:hypothetical protein
MPEYPTDAYCAHCNESPESGSHMLGPGAHGYVPPTVNDVCACGRARGAGVHARGAANGHAWEPFTTPPAPFVASNLMRVMLEERPGMPQFGVLVGMWLDERGDMQTVVRLDNYGIMLKVVHPSKVTPVTPEQEAAYKP